VAINFYFTSITCATSAHIVLQESGLQYQAHYVNLADSRHHSTDYIDTNPKGAVPALKLSNGEVLTENQAILTYIADQVPDKLLIPRANTFTRARAHEWMNYCSSSIHSYVRSVFRPAAYAGDSLSGQVAVKQQGLANMQTACNIVERQLSDQIKFDDSWSLGEHFSVCDAYLYIMYLWSRDTRMGELPDCPKWHQLALKVHQRPSTQIILQRELEFRPDYQFPDEFNQ